MKAIQAAKTLTIATVLAAGLSSGTIAAEVNLPLSEMKFAPADPNNPAGLQTSMLWGDLLASANGFMVKLPAGYSSPVHYHTADYRGVVIAGVIENPQEKEGDPKKLNAGSYWFQPGSANHITRCVSDVDCLVYVAFDGPYDAK